jgi:hypothetical protein
MHSTPLTRQVECVPYTSPLTAAIPTHLMPELPRRSRGDVVPVQPFTVTIMPEVRAWVIRGRHVMSVLAEKPGAQANPSP